MMRAIVKSVLAVLCLLAWSQSIPAILVGPTTPDLLPERTHLELIEVEVGTWDGFSQTDDCPSNQVCAEWFSNGPMNGAQCCITIQDMASDDFGACLTVLRGPRDGNML